MRLLPYGDTALLLDCVSLEEAQGWHAALHEADMVLGAQSVLLRGDPGALRELVGRTTPVGAAVGASSPPIEIAVRYDGVDLDEVAALTGLSLGDVVELHCAGPWTVAFGGFAPGFCYLVGGDRRLTVPRRASPRTRIPAGSVALADRFSGIYPSDSPGGWQIIGHTDARLWDLDREPPALLAPGQRVRFVAVV